MSDFDNFNENYNSAAAASASAAATGSASSRNHNESRSNLGFQLRSVHGVVKIVTVACLLVLIPTSSVNMECFSLYGGGWVLTTVITCLIVSAGLFALMIFNLVNLFQKWPIILMIGYHAVGALIWSSNITLACFLARFHGRCIHVVTFKEYYISIQSGFIAGFGCIVVLSMIYECAICFRYFHLFIDRQQLHGSGSTGHSNTAAPADY